MPRAGLTPLLVTEEAARFSDEEGFAALSLSSLAKRLGVTTPSLYKHVDGLDGLRREIAILGATELGERLRDATVGRAGEDALRSAAHAFRRYAHTYPGRYASLQHAPRSFDDQAHRAAMGPVKVLAAVLRGFGIGDEQSVHAIRALRSALHGFVDLEARGGFGLPEDIDKSYSVLVEGLIRSFRNWPGAAAPEPHDEEAN